MTPLMLAAMLLLAALMALAPPKDFPNRAKCGDDRGVDRCDAAVQEDVRKRYGVGEIEAFAGKLTWVRRAFYVGGYGQDQALISFIDRDGAEPIVEVRSLDTEGKLFVMSAPYPRPAFRDLMKETELFHRALMPSAADDPLICGHSSVVTIEEAKPVDGYEDGFGRMIVRREVKKRTQTACGASPTWQAAIAIRAAALQAFPWCASMSGRASFRGEADQLAFCTRFSGDRYAAADAYLSFNEFIKNPPYEWEDWVHWEWNADPKRGAKAREALAPMFGDARLFAHRIEGKDADRAVITGIVVRDRKGADRKTEARERARFMLVWLRAARGSVDTDFKIDGVELGPFVADPPPPTPDR